MHCIATILDKQGHPVAAGEALHEALLIEEEQHGADALDTAMTMNNLGVLCVHARDYQKGLVYLERAHTVRLQQLGAAHHLTELTARNIHQCREAMHSAAYADDNNSSS